MLRTVFISETCEKTGRSAERALERRGERQCPDREKAEKYRDAMAPLPGNHYFSNRTRIERVT